MDKNISWGSKIPVTLVKGLGYVIRGVNRKSMGVS